MSVFDVTKVCRLCLRNENLVWIFDGRFDNTNNLQHVIYVTTGVQDHCKEYLKIADVKISNTSTPINNEGTAVKKDLKQENNILQRIHPSVTDLFKIYPQIKLPNICLKSNIAPCVEMEIDEVEHYFKRRNLNMKPFIYLALRSNKPTPQKTFPPKSVDTSVSVGEVIEKSINQALPHKTDRTLEELNLNKNKEVLQKTDNTVRKDEKWAQPVSINANSSKLSSKVNDNHIINKGSANINNNNTLKNEVFNSKTKKDVPKTVSEDKTSTSDTSNSRKRKLSESSTCTKEENKKPAFIECLGLTPASKPKNDDSIMPLSYVEKQVALHICDICNSVQYNFKDLKKHQLKHLRCQFCKYKFKTMDLKNEHIEKTCLIKNTMNNLPNVELQKIEFNLKIRQRHPNAFIDFPIIPGMKIQDSLNKTDVSLLKTKESEKPSDEVIEILSDEDEPSTSKTKTISVNNNSNNVAECSKNTNITQSSNPDNVVSVSIVKPDIKIKNNSILDNIDLKATDINIVKDLLKNYRTLQFKNDREVQTNLPSNVDITKLRDNTTELKNLKPLLYVYKIPVVIKKGPYKVSYDYEPKPKKTRKFCLWNDLKPIDVKMPLPTKKVCNASAISSTAPTKNVVTYKSKNNSKNNLSATSSTVAAYPNNSTRSVPTFIAPKPSNYNVNFNNKPSNASQPINTTKSSGNYTPSTTENFSINFSNSALKENYSSSSTTVSRPNNSSKSVGTFVAPTQGNSNVNITKNNQSNSIVVAAQTINNNTMSVQSLAARTQESSNINFTNNPLSGIFIPSAVENFSISSPNNALKENYSSSSTMASLPINNSKSLGTLVTATQGISNVNFTNNNPSSSIVVAQPINTSTGATKENSLSSTAVTQPTILNTTSTVQSVSQPKICHSVTHQSDMPSLSPLCSTTKISQNSVTSLPLAKKSTPVVLKENNTSFSPIQTNATKTFTNHSNTSTSMPNAISARDDNIPVLFSPTNNSPPVQIVTTQPLSVTVTSVKTNDPVYSNSHNLYSNVYNNSVYGSSVSNNPLLNDILSNSISSSVVQTSVAPISTFSVAPIVNTSVPMPGIIRVKNVWELK